MKIFRSVAIALAASMAMSGAALAEDLEFTLINETSGDIVEFQVSPPSEETWSSNLMPRGYVLPSGNEVTVEIADGADHCEYDIKVVLDDGREFEEFGADLCDLGSYTFED